LTVARRQLEVSPTDEFSRPITAPRRQAEVPVGASLSVPRTSSLGFELDFDVGGLGA